ncbi:GumK N-terminal domain-containing glycosyltransferase [Bacillus toyonensis]|uniref:GumK N-terminal domain-containing glycosyltransferase n=1 Tax=Bacillus toyonensis TaxID=155322 RepID=UPI000B453176|nr:glycosyltransferase [Bacillus toyonensis]OTX03955.1 glycosyl transferase [Bacillus thuringiensis serovar seoulensis]MCA1046342.1 glycosyltransferase [Bacillus toyonensis]MDO8157670.1 glycosyltransferase family 1 protein [Bacillus toyonensis]MED3200772.1 glycosyltransferase [Bacillus toyonensis]PEP80197.1 glycosyl transferase [Bacillus toyonensis]
MKKKALFATSNYWNSPFQVGTHHIAKELVRKGWEIAYISAPISPIHRMFSPTKEFYDRYEIYKKGGETFEDGKVWSYVPGALLTPNNKPILRSEIIYNHWNKLGYPNIKKLIELKNFREVDLLYFDNGLQNYLLDFINYKKSVFRMADKNSGFSNSTKALEKAETKLSQSVDRVLYTAHTLEDHVNGLKPKDTLYFPNGVNLAHFLEKKEQPVEYKSIDKPIVVYVGAIEEWFDFNLFNEMAKRMSDFAFVVIGPDKLAKQHINEIENVHILGRRSYDQLPAYLQYANVGIIPFNVKEYAHLLDYVNPLKLYEYMVSGIPVVSSKWKELELINSPAQLAENLDQFIEAIKEAVRDTDKEKYISFAKQHSWTSRVDNLLVEVLE